MAAGVEASFDNGASFEEDEGDCDDSVGEDADDDEASFQEDFDDEEDVRPLVLARIVLHAFFLI